MFGGDWLAELPDLSNLLHRDSLEHHTESHTALPLSSPRQRRSRKQQARQQDPQQVSIRSLSSEICGPMNLLSSTVLGPWTKFDDVETWHYCASEMLSYISLYATSGASPIIAFTNQVSTELDPVLGRALGVCAAHGTLALTQRHMFDRLLDQELEDLAVLSQFAPVYDTGWQWRRLETLLMEATARLQALIMYQIIRLFSDRARDFQKAAAHEALFASWVRELQLQVQILQQKPQSCGNTTIIGPVPEEVDSKVLDAAHRAILISYTVRAVHTVLNYRTCAVWNDLFTITMPASLSGPNRLLYPEYIDLWERGSTPTLDEDNGRLRNLIVAACRGVSVVQRATC
ncbi:C6 finger domain-containing protein [Colletotrichum tofieldiae]|uniref:C6 finger domain-containing protein n=1 Tax=Colletotrichum tofieldiae TaxID=708197 RepID=A0A166Y223_9PEZI|nr:C6 finger domain-containing protein [Colletotrichum tofieldiae]